MSQTMTLDEKLSLSGKDAALWDTGDREGFIRLILSMPMPPYFAKIYIEEVGIKQLIESGWNLSEAEAEFGADWINK